MPETGQRNFNLGVFAQDDWRATRRLTVNLGLRYEYESPMVVANNIYTHFDPNTGKLLAAGINASSSLNIVTPKADFSPRIGMSFSANDKTVIRAAFGTFYGVVFQNLGRQVAFPGYDMVDTYFQPATAVAQPFSLARGFPLTATRDLKNPFAVLTGLSAGSPLTISGVSFDKQNKMSLVQQWNLGVQRRLPLNLILEVNYVGNHALHLPYVIPVNVVPLAQSDAVTLTNTTTATQNAKPFPTSGSFTVTDNVGSSNYNGLQMTMRRQFTTKLAGYDKRFGIVYVDFKTQKRTLKLSGHFIKKSSQATAFCSCLERHHLMLGRRESLLNAGAGVAAATMPSALRSQSKTFKWTPLGYLAQQKNIAFGFALNYNLLTTNSDYAALVARECTIVAPENAMKWAAIHPAADRYSFSQSDAIVDFAEKHAMKVRGHTFCWHRALPTWVNETVTKENAETVLRQHIATVAGRHKGRLQSWDVVNEAIQIKDGQPNGWRRSFWYPLLGSQYVDIAFDETKKADPSAVLTYNDFGLEYDSSSDGAKRKAVLAMLRDLKRRGVPVAALGIQSHLRAVQTRTSAPTCQSSSHRSATLVWRSMSQNSTLTTVASPCREMLATARSQTSTNAILISSSARLQSRRSLPGVHGI